MAQPSQSFPFRRVLPLVQLLVCLVILWPVRERIIYGILESIDSYAPPKPKTSELQQPEPLYVVPTVTLEPRRFSPVEPDVRMRVPLLLNFPVLVAQLPYLLVSPTRREWVPKGMFVETWRALSWPFFGTLFWWLSGRGIEALRSAGRSLVHPRIRIVETVIAIILACIGVVSIIGILTSTPDDRKDIQFLMLVAGGILWGILAAATIAARVLQWRILKRQSSGPVGPLKI